MQLCVSGTYIYVYLLMCTHVNIQSELVHTASAETHSCMYSRIRERVHDICLSSIHTRFLITYSPVSVLRRIARCYTCIRCIAGTPLLYYRRSAVLYAYAKSATVDSTIIYRKIIKGYIYLRFCREFDDSNFIWFQQKKMYFLFNI